MSSTFDNYVGKPNHFNIWQIKGGEWDLMVDSNNCPLEFSDRDEANKFCQEHELSLYFSIMPDDVNSYDGIVEIKPVPTEIHNYSWIRLSDEEANQTLDGWGFNDPEIRKMLHLFLTSKNGAQQSDRWLDFAHNYKTQVDKFKDNVEFARAVRSLYCARSYHSTLSKLQVFNPPHPKNL